jgi:large subunit ribosomal protein L29
MAKAKDIRDMTDEVLLEHLREARQEIFGLRFKHATGELENTARLGGAKRDLARTLTIARERGIDIKNESRADTHG